MENRTNMTFAAGIDLGGTFVKLALVSDNGQIHLEDSLKIKSGAQRQDVLDTIDAAISRIVEYCTGEGNRISGIGTGVAVLGPDFRYLDRISGTGTGFPVPGPDFRHGDWISGTGTGFAVPGLDF